MTLRFDLFNDESNISPMNFNLQHRLKQTLGDKRTDTQNSFTFHEKKRFSFKCQTSHISKINSFLDLKRNKRPLDNKS